MTIEDSRSVDSIVCNITDPDDEQGGMRMTVKLMKQGEGVVLFLEGRIDTMTAPEAQEALLPMADEYENLTLDFDKVSFVSSAGLRVLLMLQKKCNAQGREMKLVHVKQSIMEVFDMTGFSGMLHIE